jgi:hypothetical protein
MTFRFLPLFFVPASLKSKRVGVWKERMVGGASSPGTRELETQYLSYMPSSKIIIIMAQKESVRKKFEKELKSL